MAKRRTKKEKKNAKHNIKVTWKPKSSTGSNKDHVKGQTTKKNKSSASKSFSGKNSNYSANPGVLASIKKDIVKSIGLAGLIIGLEVMIYLFL